MAHTTEDGGGAQANDGKHGDIRDVVTGNENWAMVEFQLTMATFNHLEPWSMLEMTRLVGTAMFNVTACFDVVHTCGLRLPITSMMLVVRMMLLD